MRTRLFTILVKYFKDITPLHFSIINTSIKITYDGSGVAFELLLCKELVDMRHGEGDTFYFTIDQSKL